MDFRIKTILVIQLIPECQAEGKIAGSWSSFGGITAFASEGKPSLGKCLFKSTNVKLCTTTNVNNFMQRLR